MMYALIYIFIILFNHFCNGKISEDLLSRNVTSEQILQKDPNGNCYFPPFCRLNITKCNIPKIPIEDITFEEFHDNYYLPQKPVIIQFCANKSIDCDLSSVIDTSTDLFEWYNIASIILSQQEYQNLIHIDANGTCQDRSDGTTIQELELREHGDKQMYNGIHQPLFFEEIDIYNDLIGFLSTSDRHRVWSNKWVVFGAAGGGATFHFDYYFSAFWNMVVSGSKYWVLMDGNDVMKFWRTKTVHKISNLTNIEFFDRFYLNKVLSKHVHKFKPYECIQEKGDLIYTPSLMFHVTVNLERSLSVTQNLITRRNYAQALYLMSDTKWEKMKHMDDEDYSIYEMMELCTALNHYDEELFANSICATNTFLRKLDGVRRDGSKLYAESCNFARNHPQHSDFR